MKKSLYRTIMDNTSTKALFIGIAVEFVLTIPLVIAAINNT